MKYLIKSQRDDCYFTGFISGHGSVCLGIIQDAKIYDDKYSALQDMKKMGQCGQRIIAVTRVGKNKYGEAKKID